jgi:hypothetical protein
MAEASRLLRFLYGNPYRKLNKIVSQNRLKIIDYNFIHYIIESRENYKTRLLFNEMLLHLNNLKFDSGFISKVSNRVPQCP